jgi:DNA-directed RNA polymerase specialized sigma24 family protein
VRCGSNLFRALEGEWAVVGTSELGVDRRAAWSRDEPAIAGFATPAEVVRRCQVRGDSKTSNELFGALLRLAEADELAGRAVLHAILPALVGLTHRVRTGPGTAWPDPDQLDQDVVTIAWEQIVRLSGQALQWPAMAVVNATWERLRTVRAQHQRHNRPLVELSEATPAEEYGERPAAEQLLALLGEAVRQGAIDTESASLIFRTRVAGFSPAEIAAASGRHAKAVYKQRDRAERALVAAWAGLAAAS